MVLYSSVDKGLDLLLNNKELIISVLTMIALFVKIIDDVVKGNKTFSNIGEVRRTSVAVGKVVDKGLEKVEEVVRNNSEKIDATLEKFDKRDVQIDDLTKLVFLLIQTANIPVAHKREFLDALNNKGNVGIEMAKINLEAGLNVKEEQIKVEEEKLDGKLKALEDLE